MGCLHGVTVDIEGVHAIADFEVIEIVDDSNSYPALLGIDWVFDRDVVINLKKRDMTFEKKELRVIVPLDPTKGVRYIEPVGDYYEENDIEHIYKLTVWNEDWINPMVDGRITWEKDKSCNSDSNEELEHW